MPSVLPPVLQRITAGVVLILSLVCPSAWSHELTTHPRVVRWQWHKPFAAQLTAIDLSWEGQTVAFALTPLASGEANRLHVLDATGRERWTATREPRMLGVSLSADGEYLAVGLMDFSVALFSMTGEPLWERKSVGLPYLTASGEHLIAFNSGLTGIAHPLLEIFQQNGEKVWSLRRRGRVWRASVSDQHDLLLSLWNGEVLLIDRHRRIAWQRSFVEDVLTLSISPSDARYIAVGTGVLEPRLHLFERTGRSLWQRNVPYGVTEISLANNGAFLLTYGNTIHGQHLALYNRSGEVQWTYLLEAPAAESSKAVLVPNEPLVIAGLERDRQYYLQGFALNGELLWIAPVPEPIFDFRVSRDGRFIAAATDHAVYFFDTRAATEPEAQLYR